MKRKSLFLAVATLLAASYVNAGQLTTEQQIAEKSAQIFHDTNPPAMVMAIIQNGQVTYHAYGETAKGNHTSPTPDSLLRVGSMSKILASELLVKLADKGALGLTDPLQKYAPPGMTVPEVSHGNPVTLLSLATHTSGLPRLIPGQAPAGAAPFTWPDRPARWRWLNQKPTLTAPWEQAQYSNVGYDLLADAMEAAGKKTYLQLMRENVTGPLGMKDTTTQPDGAQCQRLMEGSGIDPAGPCTDTTAAAGNGGMYSTARDMASWMQHLLNIRHSDKPALRAVQQAMYVQRQQLKSITGLDLAGKAQGLGMGWVFIRPSVDSPVMIQKTGGGGGFMSYMVLVPGEKTGIFVSVTKVDLDMFSTLTRETNSLIPLLLKAAHGERVSPAS